MILLSAYFFASIVGTTIALVLIRNGRVVERNARCLDGRKAETEARIAARHEAERAR